MKRKFTFLIAAAVMLLTMMATTGRMWGQTRTTQTASYGFESGDADWTTTGFNSASGTTNLPTHEGAKYGETTNNSHTANSCNVKYNSIIANPQSISCWYTKKSSNTNSSSKFVIQTSTDGSTWTTRATGNTMNNVTSGTWYELTADLSSYNDIYVRVAYEGTSAIRILDDITLTYDDGQSPSTDPVISFSPASVTLDYVLVNNQASTTFTVSQSNLEEGISLSVDNGELSQNSIDKDADPTSISWTYTPTTAGAISATVTATSGETSQTLEISGTAIAPVESYDVDFEYATNMYPNWTFDNMTTYQTGSITAHGGTYYGTTGGKTTASLTTTEKVENPGTLTCYVSKASNNNTSSTWYIQVSTDGTSWTEVKSQDATSMSKGTWVEFTADLSNYSNVYARIYYEGSTAVRTIDDLTLTTAAPSNIFTVTYDANGATAGTVPVDETQYDSDNNTVTVLGNTGNLAKAGYIWSGWITQADGTGTTYQADDTFEITASTTLYAKWNAKTITGLAYTGTPTKTEYLSGESFDPAGLTVTATFNDDSQEDVTTSVVWTPDPLTTGTTSVTGTYMGQTINVTGLTVTAAPGSQENPYTVADALAASPSTGVYVTGIISTITEVNTSYHNATYRISDDGTTSNEMIVYRGRYLNNADFTSADQIQLGDEVVVTGNLTVYSNANQLAQGNYLVSLVRKVQTPTFYPEAGAVASGTIVTISCATEGATIYYTTDGTDPTTESTQGTSVTITNACTVKALAVKEGCTNSDIATAEYTIAAPVATPTFSVAEGTYNFAQSVEIECTTEGATIYYTTDGSDPTTESTEYTEAIVVSETKTIKAIGVKAGLANSDVASATYTINIPVINASNVNLAYDATVGSIAYTLTNEVEGGALTAEKTEGDWLTVGEVGAESVALTCTVNEGEADRTATVTLTYTYETHTVTKVVTVTQAHFVVDYATLPFSFNSGKADIESTVGLTQSGLGSDYSDANTKLKFDGTGDWLILKFNEVPGTLSFEIKGNGFSGGTFTVQTSIDGTVYTDKESYTEISSTATTKTIQDLASDVRYVKWIYTNKSNGNVGLGNIALAAYQEQVATPTFTPAEGEYAETQSVTIDCTTEGATIYYTLDGTDPTTESTEYSGAIEVATTTTIKAIAAKDGMNNSAVATATYTINIPVLTASITVNPATVEATADGGDGTLTVTYDNITEVEAEVYFCDAEGEAATYGDWIQAEIDDNNNVYYIIGANDGEARTAYFKVYALDDNAEDVYSNLVTINQAAHVPPVVADNYELFSGDLEEGDYIIYYNGYAMKNTVSSNRLNYETVTPSENVISTNDATIVWHIASSGNYWTIYSADANAYAASTGTKNQAQMLGDGTDDKALWTASGTSTYEFVNKYNDEHSVNRNLRNNGTNGFACYSSQTGGALSLYKKVDNTPSITLSSYEIEAPAEGVDGTLTVTYKNIETTVGASIYWFESDGETSATEPDWMSAEINETTLNVDYLIGENTGAARNAYFKVCGSDSEANLVYSNLVTISQESGLPVATITLTDSGSSYTPDGPYHIELPSDPSGGFIDIIEYNNFQSTLVADNFNIEYFDSDNEPLSGKPEWIELLQVYSQEEQLRLLIAVYANTTAEQRTTYFKVWAMNGEEKVYSDIVTLTQAGVDYATLPFEYEGGVLSDFSALTGTSYSLDDESSYAPGNAPYRIKFTKTGDYLLVKCNEQPGVVTIGVKVFNTGNDSKITVQGSTDGETYTDIQELTISASSAGVKSLVTTASFSETHRFVKLLFTKGVNVGVGPITISQVDNTPSLSFNGSSANIGTYAVGEEITLDNIIVSQHNLTEDIALNVTKGTVNPNSIVAGAEPTEVVWSYTPTEAGYTTATITATSGTIEDSFEIQFVAKTPHNINIASVEHGTIVVLGDKTKAIENENVDFTVTPDEYYGLDEITITDGVNNIEFNDYDTFYRFQMPDSDVTINATFTALPTYTITFNVNGNPDGELIITQGNSTQLPTESIHTPTGFSISGWAEDGSTIAVADPFTPTEDVTLNALFQLNNPPTASGDYVKVTEGLTDWSGEYLIVYEDGNVAFDGSLETFDDTENTVNVVISNSTIVANDDMNNAAFTIAPMTGGGYSIQGTSGKYIGVGSYANGLTTNDDPVANAISIDASGNALITITFTDGDMTLKYNNANNQLRFRYYKSGQQDIQLYKKETTSFNYVEILDNTDPEQEWDEPIPESTCLVVPENVVLTYTGPNPSVPEALVIQDGGQLIIESDINATLQIGVSGYGSKSGDGWYLISSPVDDLPTSAVATGTYDLFAYDEETAYWWVDHAIPGQTANHTFTTLERGKGYLYANTTDVYLNYAGTMKATNANISVDLSYDCDDYPDLKGFNLVGNPYTRNIVAGNMRMTYENSKADSVVTVYYDFNDERTEFVTYMLEERPIQPGQGFFIQAGAIGQTLQFTSQTDTKDANGYIRISAGDENFTDKAYIQFGGGNTLRKMTFSGDKSQVYVMHHHEDYAAARIYSTTGSVPVNFEAAYEGIYTITLEAKNLDLETLRLIDNMTGDEIDLLAEPSYTFKANSDEPAERFTLLFEKSILGIDENNAENEVFAYQNGSEIYLSGEGTLQVFDVMGRYVASYEVNGSKRISTSLFNTGVYIFKMTGENNMTQKIVVR